MVAAAPEDITLFIGTFTPPTGRAEGIYTYRLSLDSGRLEHVHTTPNPNNPAFLAIAPGGRFLYAVDEVSAFAGTGGGGATAYAIDAQSGALTELNSQPVGSNGPCYVLVHPSNRWAITANYSGGSVSVLPIATDGQLGTRSALVQHQGTSINTDRQEAAHAHCAVMDPSGQLMLVADLGMDKIVVYRLDTQSGTLAPAALPFVRTAPGVGPRHLAFGRDGRYLYCTNELDSSVTVFAYDAGCERLAEIETVSMLPAGFSGVNYPSHLALRPDGRFLYAANRGHDSIAIFAVDQANGRLTPAGHAPTEGKFPRHFAIDPSGRYLLAGNQDSDTLATFRINPADGSLALLDVLAVPSPVCIAFLAPAA